MIMASEFSEILNTYNSVYKVLRGKVLRGKEKAISILYKLFQNIKSLSFYDANIIELSVYKQLL